MKNKIKNDLILVGTILFLATFVFLIFKLSLKPGGSVVINVNGQEKYRFSLNQDLEEFVICDGTNKNTIKIEDGKVWVENATCPDKICVSHVPIKNDGETIVCLPNKVVVAVEE